MNVRNYFVGVAVSLCMACASHAGIYVEYRSGTATGWLPWFTNTSTSVDVLNLDLDSFIPPLASGTYYIRVWCSSPATEDLPFIYIGNNDPNRSVVLLVGYGANNLSPASGFLPACRDLTGIRASGAYLTAQISVGRDIRKPNNLPVEYNHSDIDHLIRLDVGGSINSNVYQVGDDVSMGPVYCGSIGANGSVQARGENSNISLINVNNGNVAGPIYAVHGNIDTLNVSAGNVTGKIQAIRGSFGNFNISGALASPDDPSDPVGSWPIRSLNGINKLVAGSISANITAMHDGLAGGGDGAVGLIKTLNGSMTKGLALKELVNPIGGGESGIIINGGFPDGASMRFFNGAPRSKSIIIRDSFGGTIDFEDYQDLDMPIVVNAGNGAGTWTGTGKVRLNWNATSGESTATLSTTAPVPSGPTFQGPYYRATPAQLGGGSIGVVPFHLHDYASVPTNPASGTSPTPINLDTGSVVLEFYGPVRAESQTVSPVEIEYVGTNSDDPYAALWFTAVVSGRKLTLTRIACIPPGTYTVTPVLTGTNRLLCDVPGFASPPVTDFSYRFAVSSGGSDCGGGECPACAADFDQDGGVTGGDIGAFFAAFEAGLPCADVDQDGGVTGGDLGAFFAVYEAGGCS